MMSNQYLTAILPMDIASMDIASMDIASMDIASMNAASIGTGPVSIVKSSEKPLCICGVSRVTVEFGRGYSQPPKSSGHNVSEDNSRVVPYTDEAKVEPSVAAIKRCTHEHGAQACILALEYIDCLVDLTVSRLLGPLSRRHQYEFF
jgi:hypothetical protein